MEKFDLFEITDEELFSSLEKRIEFGEKISRYLVENKCSLGRLDVLVLRLLSYYRGNDKLPGLDPSGIEIALFDLTSQIVKEKAISCLPVTERVN